MKLLVADDHTLFRDALLQYIERAEPEAETLLANDLQGAFSYLEAGEKPDLILLDYRMPGMNGLKGLEKLRKSYPDFRVVMMSGVVELPEIQEAIDLGIVGYFPKTMSGKAFIKAIQLVATGEKFFSFDSEAHSLMPSYYADHEDKKYTGSNGQGSTASAEKNAELLEKLSEREKEVLSYLVNGDSNKEIANKLDLQVVTVKLHVRGICRKLGAKNRTQAALIAQENDFKQSVNS